MQPRIFDRGGTASNCVRVRAPERPARHSESGDLSRDRHAGPHDERGRVPARPKAAALLPVGRAHPRVGIYEDGAALPLRNLAAFLDDVRLLRQRAPAGSLCDMDLYTGILMRFVKPTDAYLGLAQEGDTVMMDLTWTRGGDATTPRLDMDVFQELEQLAFDKHGARPHWGKNRNAPFHGASAKYPKLKDSLAVKAKFDPAGVFSSEWSDAILGIQGNVTSDAPFCAIEGNCKCSRNEHCAPRDGYFCRPGLVYSDARVCRYNGTSM